MHLKDKHIVLVCSEFPPQPGGIGTHAHQVANYLCQSGYLVTVITDMRSKSGMVERDFDAGLAFKVKRIKWCRWRVLMYIDRLLTVFKQIGRASIVLASGKFSLWSVGLFSLFFNSKYIAVVHGSEVNYKPILLKQSVTMALRRFNRVIAVSHFTKGLIAKLGIDHVAVIPNGYDPHMWQPKIEQSIALVGSPKLITVGRISERKGQLEVIKNLPALLAFYPNIHYHCIGLADANAECLDMVKKLGVMEHVTFHGVLDKAVLPAYVAAGDIFVMLSTETDQGDVEGFGIAIIEANAMGVPAIGTKDSGVEDAINDGVSGLLVPQKDTANLREAVDTILQHKDRFRDGALAWAEQHQWHHVIRRYVDVVEDGR
ncbi:glycosyltransferase family 4 protein [Snuella sedimenti]|uniref:Glycosyltransferase family 4 protein n=1 Tax=Snuella sedimenti TaxID=2798802 RepID=A0A8J7LY39_9FLAO|nr:glycosyltransferase family 4 protein [Snuella sedimenti]MBJ6367916.1 glycosyltransferase family 4 protein [Snuella sedimenti]